MSQETVKLENFTEEESKVVFGKIMKVVEAESAYLKPVPFIDKDGTLKADLLIYKIVEKTDVKESTDSKTEKSS